MNRINNSLQREILLAMTPQWKHTAKQIWFIAKILFFFFYKNWICGFVPVLWINTAHIPKSYLPAGRARLKLSRSMRLCGASPFRDSSNGVIFQNFCQTYFLCTFYLHRHFMLLVNNINRDLPFYEQHFRKYKTASSYSRKCKILEG